MNGKLVYSTWDHNQAIVILFNFRRLYMLGWGSTVGSVPIVDTALSYSILVLMLATRSIELLPHIGEQDDLSIREIDSYQI